MRPSGVVIRVPAKVNLGLYVGPLGSDGFHEIVTVFQAISLYDDVTVKYGIEGAGITLDASGSTAASVPLDQTNLAYRAADLMVRKFQLESDIDIHLKKEIPVAGGMAGGSADAAGVIVGIDSLFELGLSREELHALGAELGSDVPFSIAGGTAIGRGRGDQLTPVLAQGTYQWVLALSHSGLSTPSVYGECDRLREGLTISKPTANDALLQALRAGNAADLGKVLSNDLRWSPDPH